MNLFIEDYCPSREGYKRLSEKICIHLSEKQHHMNWRRSRKTCQRKGGDLATFYSKEEQEEVLSYLEQLGTAAYDKRMTIVCVYRNVSNKRSYSHGPQPILVPCPLYIKIG